MIMVIFGAASYDLVPSRPPKRYKRSDQAVGFSCFNRPPLSAELFHDGGFFTDSLILFPQCKPIVPHLQSIAQEETLEHVLETLQAEGEKDLSASARWQQSVSTFITSGSANVSGMMRHME